MTEDDIKLAEAIAGHVFSRAYDQSDDNTHTKPVSTAEFLDAIMACKALQIKPGDQLFDDISSLALYKVFGDQEVRDSV
jgi:hypothetical protein